MTERPTYVVVTAARDEQENLRRLAEALSAQTLRPSRWIIVENGSTDSTPAVCRNIVETHRWAELLVSDGSSEPVRGWPIVRALHRAIAELVDSPPDILVNVDADTSMDPRYLESLIREFIADDNLGIASGVELELHGGRWRPRHLTGSSVFGPTRAFRWECLQEILPFDERTGWDGIDQLKANGRGWRTQAFPHLTFKHHRAVGSRDAGTWAQWYAQGEHAHYTHYRPLYVTARATFRALAQPAAGLGLLHGYLSAAARRRPRLADTAARDFVRRQQRLRELPGRALQALGHRPPGDHSLPGPMLRTRRSATR